MKIIPEMPMTEDMLISSSVSLDADADAHGDAWRGEWDAGYAGGYADGDVVRRGLELYKSLTDDNADDPGVALDPPTWFNVDKIMRWRMFDKFLNTYAEAEGELTVVLDVAGADHIALFNLDAVDLIVEILDAEAEVLWSYARDILMDGMDINDVYDFFFAPYPLPIRNVVIPLGFPPDQHVGEVVRVRLRSDGPVRCGMCFVGYADQLGDTLYKPAAGCAGFGFEDVDPQGRRYIRKGPEIRLHRGTLRVPRPAYDAVYRKLGAALEAPAVYDLNNHPGTSHDALITYATLDDFDHVLEGPNHVSLSLELRGFI